MYNIQTSENIISYLKYIAAHEHTCAVHTKNINRKIADVFYKTFYKIVSNLAFGIGILCMQIKMNY